MGKEKQQESEPVPSVTIEEPAQKPAHPTSWADVFRTSDARTPRTPLSQLFPIPDMLSERPTYGVVATTGPTTSEVEALREQTACNRSVRSDCRDELCRLLFICVVTLCVFFLIGAMAGWFKCKPTAIRAPQWQIAKGSEKWVRTAETNLMLTFDSKGQAKVLRAIRRPGQAVMNRLQKEIHAVSCE